MSRIALFQSDPNEYECPQCKQTCIVGLVHVCPTTVPKQIQYQQKGLLVDNTYVPRKKYDIAVKALQEIVKFYGQVCNMFEICRHPECHSSCDSWLTAHTALEELGEEKPDSEPYHLHTCHRHYVEIPVKRRSTGKSRLSVCCICEGDECDDCGMTDKELYGKDAEENQSN